MTAPSGTASYGWSDGSRQSTYSYLGEETVRLLHRYQAKRVLDIGAGDGTMCGELDRLQFDVVGVEADHAGVAIAKERHPQVRFFQSDLRQTFESLLDGEARFDTVVSIEVIEHMHSPEDLPRFAAQSLVEGGHLIVSTPYHGYLKNLAIAITDHWDTHHHPLDTGGHVKFWSRQTLQTLLEREGFDVVDFSGVGRVPWLWKSMFLVARKRPEGT